MKEHRGKARTQGRSHRGEKERATKETAVKKDSIAETAFFSSDIPSVMADSRRC